MEQALGTALLVMLIGMVTVFIILSFVVLSGRLLIRAVNAFTTEDIPTKSINPEHIAVITSVVQGVTDGNVKHINIEKI